MADTYKGESLGKKMARLLFWMSVRHYLKDRFYKEKILVLASREGGDISVLLGIDVDPRMIVPVELDASAARACQERWPQVRVLNANALDISLPRTRALCAAFYDFCSPLDSKQAESLVSIARDMRSGSVLGFAGMRGRERNIAMKRYAAIARAKEEQASAQEGEHDGWALDSDGVDHGFENRQDVSRMRAVQHHLINHLKGARISPTAISCINYQSNTSESNGVPMTIGAVRIDRMPEARPEAFHRRALQAEVEAANESGSMGFFGDFKSTERKRFVECIRRMPNRPTKELALLLNTPERTIAAIRAHATRGTYND